MYAYYINQGPRYRATEATNSPWAATLRLFLAPRRSLSRLHFAGKVGLLIGPVKWPKLTQKQDKHGQNVDVHFGCVHKLTPFSNRTHVLRSSVLRETFRFTFALANVLYSTAILSDNLW